MAVPLFDTSAPLVELRAELRAAVTRVLDSERYILGPEVSAFEREFARRLLRRAEHAIGVANGTEAITIALRAMGVGPGDEVVVPSFTFYASVEAIPPTGATPVFCDIDPDTYCVSADTVRAALTPRTKAVIAVHLFGNVAPVAEIEALGVPVLEDAAQAAGVDRRRRWAARARARDTAATFSFFPSKNLGAFGDGGAITTRDRGRGRISRVRSRCASTARTTRSATSRSATTLAPGRAQQGGDPGACSCRRPRRLGGRRRASGRVLRTGRSRRAARRCRRRSPTARRRGTWMSSRDDPQAERLGRRARGPPTSGTSRTTARRCTASRRCARGPAGSSCRRPNTPRSGTSQSRSARC